MSEQPESEPAGSVPEGVVRVAQAYWAGLPADERSRRLEFVEGAAATVDPLTMPEFEQQTAQYPESGPPGISYVARRHPAGVAVNCLLHRDEAGVLDGIYNHYPQGVPGLQEPNTDNMWVRPDRRGRGIGRELLMARFAAGWPYNLGAVRLSPEGLQALRSAMKWFGPLPGDGPSGVAGGSEPAKPAVE